MNKGLDDEDELKGKINDEDEFIDLKEALKEIKKEFSEQMRDLKDDINEIKDEIQPEFSRTRRKRRIKQPKSHSIRIQADDWEDWGERFGNTMEHYIGGILDSIGDTIDRSVGTIFHTGPSSRRGRRRDRKMRRKEPYFVPEEKLEDFYIKGSAIMGALSDQTRLKMLKELEKEPLRQSDLSQRTETRGGNFKHHITILKDEGLVRQEGVRERYLLTFAGREALKLVEFLYTRANKRIAIPVEISDAEEEEEIYQDQSEEE